MKIIAYLFENSTKDYVFYSDIIRNCKISRIMIDIILKKILDEGLLDNKKYGATTPRLTDKGKYYAIEHKLIK